MSVLSSFDLPMLDEDRDLLLLQYYTNVHTTIAHTLQTSRIKEFIQRCFSQKNGEEI
jgi:hypothetical protein